MNLNFSREDKDSDNNNNKANLRGINDEELDKLKVRIG